MIAQDRRLRRAGAKEGAPSSKSSLFLIIITCIWGNLFQKVLLYTYSVHYIYYLFYTSNRHFKGKGMMIRKISTLTATVIFAAASVYSQAVSFSSPVPWTTQRNDTIIARAQIDTAQIKKKSIFMTLSLFSNGKKSTLSSKTFKISDYAGEFSFGRINRNLVGGRDFLQIDWSIPGGQMKGTIAPVGIVNLDKVKKSEPVKAIAAASGATPAALVSAVKDENFQKAGKIEFATAWNKEALFIVLKKNQEPGAVQFSLDGKSGKNAFVSYPDRFISYTPANDSLAAFHFTRDLKDNVIRYASEKWQTEITKEVTGDKVVIRVPWYDTGVVPFEERSIGFGVFAVDQKEKVTASVPEGAQAFIPGTWGNLVLQK